VANGLHLTDDLDVTNESAAMKEPGCDERPGA